MTASTSGHASLPPHPQQLSAGMSDRIDLEPLPAADTEAGSPASGALELGAIGGCQIGLWEITPGTCRDVEADEVFIVLSGSAEIEFLEEDAAAPQPLQIGPGDVVRLHAGQRTRWRVDQTLRKVYLLPKT